MIRIRILNVMPRCNNLKKLRDTKNNLVSFKARWLANGYITLKATILRRHCGKGNGMVCFFQQFSSENEICEQQIFADMCPIASILCNYFHAELQSIFYSPSPKPFHNVKHPARWEDFVPLLIPCILYCKFVLAIYDPRYSWLCDILVYFLHG